MGMRQTTNKQTNMNFIFCRNVTKVTFACTGGKLKVTGYHRSPRVQNARRRIWKATSHRPNWQSQTQSNRLVRHFVRPRQGYDCSQAADAGPQAVGEFGRCHTQSLLSLVPSCYIRTFFLPCDLLRHHMADFLIRGIESGTLECEKDVSDVPLLSHRHFIEKIGHLTLRTCTHQHTHTHMGAWAPARMREWV